MTEEEFTNHLANEKSPYLQQHAHNPVEWYPWGEEAFELARSEDRPILLSIGYATCHWCHVMEKETFSNREVAELMNELFVCIKVDREERPDVDSLYMDFAQAMLGGAAGWPLNLVLTTDLRPFYAATYLPPSSAQGLIGMCELVARIKQIWYGEERQLVQEQAQEVLDSFLGAVSYSGEEMPDELDLENAAELLFRIADPVYGGIQGAPKFPIGYQNLFLLRYYFSSKDSRALYCAEKALHMMHKGGIYDHLGGGFSRYSVDEQWMIPHFEKMLYDNALLAEAYTKVWQVTQKQEYRTVAEETLDYLVRDMQSPEGGFYSAEDADSEGKEGYFYTWTPQGIAEVLGDEHAFLFCDAYGVSPEGNFEESRSILHLPNPLEEVAAIRGMDPSALQSQLTAQRKKLWESREKRERPFRDDKVLSGWNGLAIHSLAYASATLSRPDYLQAAETAVKFLKDRMWSGGILLRRYCDGEARFDAGLDEYAFLIRALLTLFEVTGKWSYLDWAVELEKVLQAKFKAENGAFFQSSGSDTQLIVRKANFADGAEPSGNAVHTENLLRLRAITGSEEYRVQAEDILRAFKENAEEGSVGFCYHLMALQRYLDNQSPLIVVALNEEEEHREEIESAIWSKYIPNRSVIWAKKENPLMSAQVAQEGKTTLYLCRGGACQEPITDIQAMKEVLNEL